MITMERKEVIDKIRMHANEIRNLGGAVCVFLPEDCVRVGVIEPNEAVEFFEEHADRIEDIMNDRAHQYVDDA